MISLKERVSQKSVAPTQSKIKIHLPKIKHKKQVLTPDEGNIESSKIKSFHAVKRPRGKTKTATTQATLRYTSLFEDGLIHVVDRSYSRIFKIGEVDYMTANDDKKMDIITRYASLLNSLDHTKHYQLFLHNSPKNIDVLDQVNLPLKNDHLDDLRKEYNLINAGNLERNQTSPKLDIHLVITVQADEADEARRSLQNVRTDVLCKFDKLTRVTELSGADTLSLIGLVTLGEKQELDFAKEVALAGSTKNLIAPNHIIFSKRDFQLNDSHARILYARSYPEFLRDNFLKDLSNTGIEFFLSIHVQPIDKDEALTEILQKTVAVKGDIAETILKAEGISEEYAVGATQRNFKQSGEELTEHIQEEQAQIYSGTVALQIQAVDVKTLDQLTKRIQSAARQHQVTFVPAMLHQESGFNTILPFGKNYLGVARAFRHDNWTTANVAASFIPWTNSDITSNSPKALQYGTNYLTKNPILLDRSSKEDLPTGAALIFGGSGSGKSSFVKFTEMLPTHLKTDDEIITVDPEGEYPAVAAAVSGQVVKLYPGAPTHLNILDKPDDSLLNRDDEDYVDPISQKILLLDNLFESILNAKDTINYGASERSLTDRVTNLVYDYYVEPTLQDWHELLKDQPEEEAQIFALKLEPFMTGSESIFSHKTNVDIDNRFVVFDLKQLKKSKLYHVAMLVVQDYIWNRVLKNQGNITTRIFFDEIQAYFDNDEMAFFFSNLYARVRKYGAIPTGITQDPGLVLQGGKAGEAIFTNTEFFAIFRLKGKNLSAISDYLDLTDEQVEFLRYADDNRGEGLIVAKNHVVQMENPIPKNTEIFKLVDTTVKNQ